MEILIILLSLFGGFNQKWFIPRGISDGAAGRICICDTDRDGNFEFIFTTYGGSFAIYFYELHLPNTWEVDSFPYLNSPLLWDIGDFDLDGLWDIVFQASAGPPNMLISIAESPDSFSYPTQEVWRDTVGPPLVLPISVYDIDQDGLPEIVKNRATPYGYIGIYESVGDNQYELIFADDPDTSGLEAPAATHAFGDFDGDENVECVFAGGDEWYWIYESPANNTYEKISEGELTTLNIRDCFSVPDADGDGKLEFVVKGFLVYGTIDAFIFEAIGDNTYEIIKTYTLPGGDYYGGYSDAGDVDGDSIPEIVLEARQNVYIIKAAGNDSFYIWDTLPGHASGSCVRIFDIDDNGLSEIVISGENETRIYEFEVNGIREDVALVTPQDNFLFFPNPFKNKVGVRYDLGKQTHVEMTVYDAAGRHVKTLVSEAQQPGYYSIVWEGFDDHGSAVPAGMYFVRIKADGYETHNKILLVK